MRRVLDQIRQILASIIRAIVIILFTCGLEAHAQERIELERWESSDGFPH